MRAGTARGRERLGGGADPGSLRLSEALPAATQHADLIAQVEPGRLAHLEFIRVPAPDLPHRMLEYRPRIMRREPAFTLAPLAVLAKGTNPSQRQAHLCQALATITTLDDPAHRRDLTLIAAVTEARGQARSEARGQARDEVAERTRTPLHRSFSDAPRITPLTDRLARLPHEQAPHAALIATTLEDPTQTLDATPPTRKPTRASRCARTRTVHAPSTGTAHTHPAHPTSTGPARPPW